MVDGQTGAVAGHDEQPDTLTLEDSMTPGSAAVNEVLTRTEAARLLRISISTLNQLDDVPRHRVGTMRRYLRSELIEYVRSRGAK